MTDKLNIRSWIMPRCQFISYDFAKDGNGYSVITMDCYRPIKDKYYQDSIHWNNVINYYCEKVDNSGYSIYFVDNIYYILYANGDCINFEGKYAEEHWDYFNTRLEDAKSLAINENK